MSCGIAIHHNTSESTIESLLSQADRAMHKNKRMKETKVTFLDYIKPL